MSRNEPLSSNTPSIHQSDFVGCEVCDGRGYVFLEPDGGQPVWCQCSLRQQRWAAMGARILCTCHEASGSFGCEVHGDDGTEEHVTTHHDALMQNLAYIFRESGGDD